MEQDIRWKQRFANFSKAYNLLREVADMDCATLSMLEKEGIVQRFEFTVELTWKTLKDKMEYDGLVLDQISPKSVIREAFRTRYISNVESWMRMIGDRNLMSHTYDFAVFEAVIPTIQHEYIETIGELYILLIESQI